MMTEVLSRDMPVRDEAPDLRAERPMADRSKLSIISCVEKIS